jgi:hypothetical protein
MRAIVILACVSSTPVSATARDRTVTGGSVTAFAISHCKAMLSLPPFSFHQVHFHFPFYGDRSGQERSTPAHALAESPRRYSKLVALRFTREACRKRKCVSRLSI